MSGKKPIYYWDSCIYIAILSDDESEWVQAALEILDRNRRAENKIITSVITKIEVLERLNSKREIDHGKESVFHSMFSPGAHEPLEVDVRTAEKARRLRSERVIRGLEKELSTPDSIHLATAIIAGVDEFHTNDEGKTKDKETMRKTVGLLHLTPADLAPDYLKICRPSVEQLVLPLV